MRLRSYPSISRLRLLPLPLLGFVAAGAGCSSGGSSPPPASKPIGQGAPHAIHLFAKQPDGTKVPLAFGPATEARVSLSASGGGGVSGTGESDGSAPIVVTPSTVESPGSDPWSTAWALVWRAAVQCGGEPSAVPPWYGVDPSASWFLFHSGWATCAERLFTEQNLLCAADKLGAVADAVGTVEWAATSLQVSGSATYQGGITNPGPNGYPALAYSDWEIPPQADADRFIARDLAIHTLAMLATLDSYSDITFPSLMTGLASPATCTQAYAWLATPANTSSTACIDSSISFPMFGADSSSTYTGANNQPTTSYPPPLFPPSSTPICDGSHNYAPAIAQSALQLEAQTLRSAGRLLHDLIRRDVYSDMAAAAQQSAQALDPINGNRSAWGQGPGGPYGSIAHAARVLLGRWEIGDVADFGNVADPTCEGVKEIDLVPSAFGGELSARTDDRSLRTAGQQTAVQLVERSGIVIPSCKIPADGADGGVAQSAEPLRRALIDQLLLEEAVQNGLQAPPSSTALDAVLATVSDDEIIFAFRRALRTWRLLTDSADTTASDDADAGGAMACAAPSPLGDATGATPLPAGFTLLTDANKAPAIASSVSSLFGIAVKGGLGRSRLVTDPMARAGGMMEASQCDDATPYWDEWGGDLAATVAERGTFDSNGLAQPPTAALPPATFQDAFHIGQAFERRLNLLQIQTSGIPTTDPANVAKGGIAELRSWAGAAIVHAWPQSLNDGTNTTNSFVVRVGGLSYARDFGMAPGDPLTAVQNAFAFVYGPPWVAECAAGVRPDCPSGFTANYVQTGTATDVTAQYASSAGVLDNVFTLNVPITGGPQQFTPPIVRALGAGTNAQRLYMIRLHDPSSPTGQGRVMGTLPLRGTWTESIAGGHVRFVLRPSTVGFVDAPMQRELVHDAIDLGSWVGAKPPVVGDPSAAETAGYCVDGVPHDLFVPLDNELVSGNATYEDSWQAYLDLAQQAAQTADTLGQQLINDDLEISKNEQAAEEQLANICGDFGALASATVGNDGRITGGADDATQSCLNEPTVDVVFLGAVPATITSAGSDADRTCAIKAAIHCAASDMAGCNSVTNASAPPRSASALCSKSTLTADALNITAGATGGVSMPAPYAVTDGCNDLLTQVIPSVDSKFLAQQYLNDLQDSTQSPGGIGAAVSQLHLYVDLANRWQVSYGSHLLMDSGDPTLWPGCINNQCAATASGVVGGGTPTPPSTPSVDQGTARMASAWSIAFRDCPSGVDPTTAALGVCNGSGAGADSVAELNMLKWRVTQALWMLGAYSGNLPYGLVRQPIPGAFGDDCQGVACSDAYFPAGYSNYYAGRPIASTSCNGAASNCYALDPSDTRTNIGDIGAIGPLFDVAPAFSAFGGESDYTPTSTGLGGEVPYWYGLLYSPDVGGTVKHFMVSNEAATFDQCSTPFGDSSKCGQGAANSAGVAPADLLSRAYGLEGVNCSQTRGGPGLTATGGGDWAALVGAVKQGISAQAMGGRVVPANGAGGDDQTVLWRYALPSTIGFYESDDTWDDSYGLGTTPVQLLLGSSNYSTWPAGLGFAAPLAPTAWYPSVRALAFSGYGATPNGTCGALHLMLQASALACSPAPQAVDLSTITLDSLPSVAHLSDIPKLTTWLSLARATLVASVNDFYVQEIPARVVSDFKNHTVGSGSLGGTKGQAILSMEQQLQALPTAWVSIASDVGSIKSAIDVANLAIVAANLNEKTTEGSLALSTIQTQGQMTAALDNFMVTVASAAGSAISSWGASLAVIPAAAVAAADATATGQQELNQLQNMGTTASQVDQNQLAQSLAQLGTTSGPLWADVQKQIDNLRGAAAQ
ncbi:MAG TPA: hypothetical protein VGI39_05410, partial [Polyangiaceae bacterium]